MKVVQILFSGLGGHSSVGFSLIEANISKKWENALIFYGVEPLAAAYQDFCRANDLENTYVEAVEGRQYLSWVKIYKALRAMRPDAIILHSVKLLPVCATYASLHRISLYSVEHQANKLKRRSEWVISAAGMFFGDGVVVLTEDYGRELKEKLRLLYRPDRVSVIPNGINCDYFSRAPRRAQGELRAPVVFGMAGRFTETKHQSSVIQALSEYVKQGAGPGCMVSFAGSGPMLESVEMLVRRLELDSLVTFEGSLNQAQLLDWFRSIDVYIHASQGETLSTAILQAMALEKPVLASDVDGIRNLLRWGGAALGDLVDTNKAPILAEAMRGIATDFDSAAAKATLAREVVEEHFSHARMFNGYNRLLSSE